MGSSLHWGRASYLGVGFGDLQGSFQSRKSPVLGLLVQVSPRTPGVLKKFRSLLPTGFLTTFSSTRWTELACTAPATWARLLYSPASRSHRPCICASTRPTPLPSGETRSQSSQEQPKGMWRRGRKLSTPPLPLGHSRIPCHLIHQGIYFSQLTDQGL